MGKVGEKGQFPNTSTRRFCKSLVGQNVLEASARREPEEVVSLHEGWTMEAMSTEMSGTFHRAVLLCLPRALIIADHFYVLQQVGRVLDKLIESFATAEEAIHSCMVCLPWNDVCMYG
jgi:transposase